MCTEALCCNSWLGVLLIQFLKLVLLNACIFWFIREVHLLINALRATTITAASSTTFLVSDSCVNLNGFLSKPYLCS